jgi:16S rRNA (adenine1518-N6/adenine1519-N6)-dimethyltransferase
MAFAHKKSLGQNFLNSDYVPRKMCDAAAIEAGDTVLEIGPGTGALTRELLARGATVHAVETDERALAVLHDDFAAAIGVGQLTLHDHDARDLAPATFDLTTHGYKVVSNIPYYLSGYLLRQLLDTPTQPSCLVFLMQKELVERIARNQKESLLSLSVKAFGDPTYVSTIKRSHFTPPPKVDSAILLIDHISHDRVGETLEPALFTLLHAGFAQKRKQLLGNLTPHFDRETVSAALAELDLSPTVRAEDLPLATWKQLVERLTG